MSYYGGNQVHEYGLQPTPGQNHITTNTLTSWIIHEPGNYNFSSPLLNKGVNYKLKAE